MPLDSATRPCTHQQTPGLRVVENERDHGRVAARETNVVHLLVGAALRVGAEFLRGGMCQGHHAIGRPVRICMR